MKNLKPKKLDLVNKGTRQFYLAENIEMLPAENILSTKFL